MGVLRAWIGLGGNLGDVPGALEFSRRALAKVSDAPLVCSGVYESEPWGVAEQPPFLNQVLGLVPRLGPVELMAALHALEDECGRRRDERWGSRTLDLDLLCWPEPVEAPGVSLPHPRLHLRRFVLVPWAEVAPRELVVGLGRTVAELLAECPEAGWVRRCS